MQINIIHNVLIFKNFRLLSIYLVDISTRILWTCYNKAAYKDLPNQFWRMSRGKTNNWQIQIISIILYYPYKIIPNKPLVKDNIANYHVS